MLFKKQYIKYIIYKIFHITEYSLMQWAYRLKTKPVKELI